MNVFTIRGALSVVLTAVGGAIRGGCRAITSSARVGKEGEESGWVGGKVRVR